MSGLNNEGGNLMGKTLTSKELKRARELEALGIPLDGELLEKSQKACSGLLIDQDPNILQTAIFDVDSRKTGVMIGMFLMNQTDHAIGLKMALLSVPWSKQIHWLEDPLRHVPAKSYYSLLNSDYPQIERDSALNHRFGPKRKLLPGESLEGLLLGWFEEPIPDQYRNRELFETTLMIFDGGNNSFPVDFKFLVTRDLKHRKRLEAAQEQVQSASAVGKSIFSKAAAV
jgi:hypothetical protein